MQTVIWKCDCCKLCGEVPLDDKSSIASIIQAINLDHAERSGDCEAGDREIRIIEERKGAA